MENSMERFCRIALEGILIFLIVFTPIAFGSVHTWAVVIIELAALLMLLLWLFRLLAQGKIEFVKTPLNYLAVIWLGFVLFQLLTVTTYFQATKTIFLQSLFFWLILLAFINNVRTKKQVQRIIIVLISTGFIISMFGIIQKLSWNGKLYWTFPLTRGGSPFGPYVNKNHFAGYIGMIIPLGIGFLFGQKGKFSLSAKPLVLIAVVVMAGALFFSLSRAGIVSLLLSLLLMGFFLIRLRSVRPKTGIVFIIAVLLLVGIAWLGSASLADRFSHLNDVSWEARQWVWKGTVGIIRDFSVFGSGLGTFMHIFPKYKLPQTKLFFRHAHNDFVEFFSEAGVFGSMLVFIVFGIFLVETVRLLFSRRDLWAVNLVIGGLASLLVIAVFSLSDFNLHIPANVLLLSLIIGLIVAVVHMRPESKGEATLFSKQVFSLNLKLRAALYPTGVVAVAAVAICVIRPFLAGRNFKDSLAAQTFEEKVSYLEKSIRLQPHDSLYRYELASLYGGEQANWDLALKHFKQAAELNPASARLWRGIAMAYSNLDMKEAAIQHVKHAIELEPNNSYHHRKLALLYLDQAKEISTEGYLQNAVSEYRKAILLKSAFAPEALENLSEFMKDYSGLKAAIPDTPEAHLEFSRYLKNKGMENESDWEFETAIKTWKSQIILASNPQAIEIYKSLADAYLGREQYDLALTEYRKALRISPDDSWIYYRIGTVYERMKDENKAIGSFKMAVFHDPAQSWACYSLARIYESKGKRHKAMAMWKTILKQNDSDPEAMAIARREIAKYYEKLNNE